MKVGLPIGFVALVVLFCTCRWLRQWRRQRGYSVVPGNASNARASSGGGSTGNNSSIIRATRRSGRSSGLAEPLLRATARLSSARIEDGIEVHVAVDVVNIRVSDINRLTNNRWA
jgi:hypothetical protein